MTTLPQGGVQISAFKEDEFRRHLIDVDKQHAAILPNCEQFRDSPNQPPADCTRAWSSAVSDDYFENMPDAVTTATSDASGNFEFVIPKNGSYVLFARSRVDSPWIETVQANGDDLRVVLDDSKLMPDYLIRILFIHE